jgi:SAM-dependent methyltransferase
MAVAPHLASPRGATVTRTLIEPMCERTGERTSECRNDKANERSVERHGASAREAIELRGGKRPTQGPSPRASPVSPRTPQGTPQGTPQRSPPPRTPQLSPQLSVSAAYDALAERYDEVERGLMWNRPVELGLVFSFARMASIHAGTVADVGCGPGHITQYMRQLDLRAVGIDLSPAMIARATASYPDCSFRTGAIEALPAAEGEWAGAVSLGATWHHDAPARRTALRELARVIRPEGALLFSWLESAPRGPADSTQRLYRWLDSEVALDLHFVSVKTALREAASAGFEVISATLREPMTSHELPARRGFLLARRR